MSGRSVEVPTMDDIANLQAQIDALDARVTELESGEPVVPPSKEPSADGTTVTDTSGQIVDGQGRTFALVGPPSNYRIDMDGAVSGGGVVRLYAKDQLCHQENGDHDWWYMGDDDWVKCTDPTDETPITPSGDYTFADEFNTLSLWNRDRPDDKAVWRPSRWYSPDEWDGWNNGAGRMVNPYNQTGTEYLYGVNADGQLYLGMDRAASEHGHCAGQPFVTSQINQLSFKQHGGYWEARIKAPVIKGTNCAFWLMNEVSWPPEIDIIELVQFADGSAVMAQNVWEMDHTTNPYYLYNFDRAAWHTYACWWDVGAGRIHLFYDEQHTQEVAQPSGYDHPMFVILSMQQGGDWSGPTPPDAQMGSLLVDYVRISKQPPGALLSAPQAAPSGVLRQPRPKGSGLGESVRRRRA